MTQLQAIRGHRPCDWGTKESVLEEAGGGGGGSLNGSASSAASSWDLAVIRAAEPGGSTWSSTWPGAGIRSIMRTLREQVVRFLTH